MVDGVLDDMVDGEEVEGFRRGEEVIGFSKSGEDRWIGDRYMSVIGS